MNALLYVITVLIWGSTWLAIHYQLGEVPVNVSVFYRFALAALLLLPFMWLNKKLEKMNRSDHGFMWLQGTCLFSLNFICFYNATQYISSGLVAVIFSLATLYNAVNNRLFWKEKIPLKVVIAGLIGSLGLVLLFLPEFQSKGLSTDTFKGLGLAALGTYFFSLGNMISKRNSLKGLKPLMTNAYAMTYGAILLAIILLVTAQPLVIDTRVEYIGALLYLSIFGSIIGFTTYLTLVANLGPNKAAYATVMFPVIALILSGLFEDYQWQPGGFIGLLLTMLGNIIINLDIEKYFNRLLHRKTG